MPTTWDSTDFDSGTDDGVVHENTTDTDYGDASGIRRGFSGANPPLASDHYLVHLFQEASAPVVDHTGNGNDSSVSGAQADGANGLYGTDVWKLDGSNDFFGQSYTETENLTLWAWVYPTGTGGSRNSNGIIDTGLNNTVGGMWIAYQDNDSSLRYTVDTTGGSRGNVQPRDWVLDEWNFVAETIDDTGGWKGWYASESVSFAQEFSQDLSGGVDTTGRDLNFGTVSFDEGGGVIGGRYGAAGITDNVALTESEIKSNFYDPVVNNATHTSTKKSL